MYSATIQLETDPYTNFKELVRYVNRDDSPFDFRIRFHSADEHNLIFDLLFYPELKTIMYYPSSPDPKKKFSTVDMAMPWLVMRFVVDHANRKGNRYSIHAHGDGYFTREPESGVTADQLPPFLGNHHVGEWCMGHDTISGFHYAPGDMNKLTSTITECVFSFVMHYVNSTFNDSLHDYKRSVTLYHVLLMAGEDPGVLNKTYNRCGKSRCVEPLQCPNPSPGFTIPHLSEGQVHAAYKYMSENDVWWAQVPKFLRGISQFPVGNGYITSSLTAGFWGFLRYYKPSSPDQYRAYIHEGYGQHRLEEFEEFHPMEQALFSAIEKARGIRNDTETLAIVNECDDIQDLINWGVKPLDDRTKQMINELSYYWNGKLVYD